MKKRRRRRRIRRIYVKLFPWVVGITFLLIVLFYSPKVVFHNSLRFPVGSALTTADLVKEVRSGKLVRDDTLLDSSKEGSIKCKVKVKNVFSITKKEKVKVEFYLTDEQLLELATLAAQQAHKGAIGEGGFYDERVPNVIRSPFAADGSLRDGTYKTQNGKTLVVKDGCATVDGYLLVNKSFPFPESADPDGLTEDTEKSYAEMRKGAREAGHTLKLDNGYRSWDIQRFLFNRYLRTDTLENVMTYSAKPGYSEHQAGVAVDLMITDTDKINDPEYKPVFDWLAENAYRYGFILRYPEGKSEITGYIYEPWHFRYVGKELAEKLYNGGDWITMEEYFGVDSVYRGK